MDIQTALRHLAASGMSDAAIGLEIGAPQSIITRLRNGIHKTTSYERGKKILALAAKNHSQKAEACTNSVARLTAERRCLERRAAPVATVPLESPQLDFGFPEIEKKEAA